MPQVLVAEDEDLLRRLILGHLELENISATSACDGEEALERLKAHPGISVLLTDIRMPGLNGYQLVDEALGIRPELKILMMTGYEIDQPPHWALQAREFRVFRKPFDMDRLGEVLLDMLSRS